MTDWTSNQRRAIAARGHTMLSAGAGSGKTSTLVAKIVHLLGADVGTGETPAAARCELGQIAAITFTNAAAAELKASLRRELRGVARRTGTREWRDRVHEVERARIGTIHAFCARMLREFGLRAGLDPSFRVLDEAEASLLRHDAVAEEVIARLRGGDADVASVVVAFGLRRTRAIVDGLAAGGEGARLAYDRWGSGDAAPALRRAVEAGGGAWLPNDDDAARLAGRLLEIGIAARHRLDAALDRERALDFDALVYRARDLLRDRPDVRHALRSRLRWLFVDEFQDTDRAQVEIAYAICGLPGGEPAAPRLCVVGDPKQSIYRFRRADVALWGDVEREILAAGGETIPLDTSFRSRAPIVAYVNAVFGAVMGEAAADAAAAEAGHEIAYAPLQVGQNRVVPDDDGAVEVIPARGDTAPARRESEAERVAARLLELRHDESVVREDASAPPRAPRWSDFAVLFRARTALPIYEAAFRRHGIPYVVAGNASFFARREVRDVRLLLAALADPDDDVALAGVLRSPFVALTDASLLRLRIAGPRRLRRALRSQSLPEPAEAARLAWAAEWWESLLSLRDRIPAAALLERALGRAGYAAHLLLQADGDVALANLRKLVGIAESHPGSSIRELLEMIAERADSGHEAEAAVQSREDDVVTLTTVHQAKGLEWPVVVLADGARDIELGGRESPPLFIDPDAGIGLQWTPQGGDSPGAYAWLKARESALSRAEEKRVLYVAATRAKDRLILCGDTAAPAAGPEAVRAAKHADAWLLHGLEFSRGRFAYQDGGRTWSGPVVDVEPIAAAALEAPAPPTPDTVVAGPIDAALARRLAPVAPRPALRVHSATELVILRNRPAEHRRIYALGLPPAEWSAAAPLAADGAAAAEPIADEQLDLLVPHATARLIGDVLHGVLERLELLAELDRILDLELGGRIGEGAPATLRDRLRAELRGMITATASHPRVAPLLRAPRHERELAFTWVARGAGAPAVMHGALDLVAIDAEPPLLRIVDYKSARAAGRETQRAREYEAQRDVYLLAAAALGPAPPAELTFFFARSGRPVPAGEAPGPVGAAALEQARRRLASDLRRIDAAAAR